MDEDARRLDLVLHIVRLESQIERTAEQSDIMALKAQRRNLYIELAAMRRNGAGSRLSQFSGPQ
jgi:hypothetical protein